MKSKTRLVFSIVLVRMIFKITILHPIQSHHYQEAHQQSFYFEYLIVTEKEENPREARQARAGKAAAHRKIYFHFDLFRMNQQHHEKNILYHPEKSSNFPSIIFIVIGEKNIREVH